MKHVFIVNPVSGKADASLYLVPKLIEAAEQAGVEYAVDTLSHYRVGPGTTVTIVDLAGPVKQRVFYTVTDLSHPDVEIKTICGKDELRSNLTVPDMVAQHADHDNVYFAGVNSDLFSATGPIGSTVVDGEVYKTAKTSTA